MPRCPHCQRIRHIRQPPASTRTCRISRAATHACAHARARDFRAKSLYLDYGNRPQSERIRRRLDQGPQGPRRGAQAARHVHRRHRRRLGPAPHGVRGVGQRDRRGARRPLRPDPDPAQPRRLGHGRGQRPRHPDRHPRRGGRLGGRGHHDPAPRRREVREHVATTMPTRSRAASTASASRSSTRSANGSSSPSGATARSISCASATAMPRRR